MKMTEPGSEIHIRITSYNVCYTKLLRAAYQAALDTLVERFEAADSARLFQAFIRDYPESSLLPNAWYWLGESYYVTQNYELALDAFRTLLDEYPASRKEADALLKLGYCQVALGQRGAGEASLRDVGRRFPGTVITSYSIHYTKLYDNVRKASRASS